MPGDDRHFHFEFDEIDESLDNVRELAETGVDFISVGALTHSAPALDVSLEL